MALKRRSTTSRSVRHFDSRGVFMTWKQKLGWIGIGFVALVVIIVIAGFFTVRGAAFHRYVIAKIEARASESMGTPVRIENFALHLSSLGADAYGITVQGNQTVPLAHADELTIRLKIVSLLHKKIDLNEIILRHPVLKIAVKKDGTTNLPTPPKTNSSSPTDPFDLGIKHVLLEQGEVYYNDVKTPLDAEVRDLRLEVRA